MLHKQCSLANKSVLCVVLCCVAVALRFEPISVQKATALETGRWMKGESEQLEHVHNDYFISSNKFESGHWTQWHNRNEFQLINNIFLFIVLVNWEAGCLPDILQGDSTASWMSSYESDVWCYEYVRTRCMEHLCKYAHENRFSSACRGMVCKCTAEWHFAPRFVGNERMKELTIPCYIMW